jgi:hypothetical protein
MSDLPASGTKPKAERLKETITLLKKLPQVGIPETSYPYRQVKDLMTTWVNDGPAITEYIDFKSHWGTLFLPTQPGKVSSLDLKAKRSA